MNKYIKTLIISAVVFMVLIAGSMVYYYVFFRPNNEKAKWQAQLKVEEEEAQAKLKLEEEKLKLEQDKQAQVKAEAYREEQEKQNKQIALNNALVELDNWYNKTLDEAYKGYMERWNDECAYRGLQPNSRLPSDIANDLTQAYEDETKRIDDLYKSQKDDLYKQYSN